jgi:hypothetical protein
MAALFVWAQLWIATAQLYSDNDASTWTVGYGLTWIYFSAGLSLLGVGITLLGGITRIAIVLVGSAFTLTFLEILISFFSVLYKVMFVGSVAEPVDFPSETVAFGLLVLIPVVIVAAWVVCVQWIEATTSFFNDLLANQY